MRILIHAGGLHQWRPTNPTCFWKDIPSPAGTELGIFGYAKALADRGHQVTVVMHVDPPGIYDGVEYLLPEGFVPQKNTYDVIVSVHYAHFFTDRWAPLQAVLALSHHLVGMEQVDSNIDRYMTPSHWGMSRLLTSHPTANPSKFWITRIGDWLERYGWTRTMEGEWLPGAKTTAAHYPKHLLWASSPDRGLWHMVDIMRRLPKYYRLTVAYDFDNFLARSDHIPTLLILRKALPLKEMDNVEFVGHLSQPKLADLLLRGGVMVYPGDVPETYAVTVNNAMAAGLPVMASAIGSFPENYGGAALLMPHPVDPAQWAEAISSLTNGTGLPYTDCQKRELELASMTDFSEVGREWELFFTQYFKGIQTTNDHGLAQRRKV